MNHTPRGAYCNTPHKTIEELRVIYLSRIAQGEQEYDVLQDIVNGYSLGWQSANHRYIVSGLK